MLGLEKVFPTLRSRKVLRYLVPRSRVFSIQWLCPSQVIVKCAGGLLETVEQQADIIKCHHLELLNISTWRLGQALATSPLNNKPEESSVSFLYPSVVTFQSHCRLYFAVVKSIW